MKKLSILLLALMCAGVVFGQETAKKKVAVYVTGGENAAINRIIGSKLVAAIAQNGKYSAIERTDAFLAQIQKEQGYQRSGAVDDNQISKLGKQFGVNFVCVAEVITAFGSQFLSARLVDVETAVVGETADESGNISDMDALIKISNSIAQKLLGGSSNTGSNSGNTGGNSDKVYLLEDYGIMVMKRDLSGEFTWQEAKNACKNSNAHGYNDWYLPSQSELDLLYKNKTQIGGFLNARYWSSSENLTVNAWFQNFTNGNQLTDGKASAYRCRCVRKYY